LADDLEEIGPAICGQAFPAVALHLTVDGVLFESFGFAEVPHERLTLYENGQGSSLGNQSLANAALQPRLSVLNAVESPRLSYKISAVLRVPKSTG
jgi:hypothetical protein